MKKTLTGLLVLGSLMLFGSGVKAATTADLILTVTPNGTKSLTLSTGTLALGTLTLGSVNNVSSSVTVTNNGTVPETLGLRIKTADGVWTSSSTVGADRYNLRALFNSVAPAAGNFLANDDVVTQGSAVLATGVGAVYSGDQDGSVFNATTTRGLWFKIDMPTSSTIMTLRSFTVEVSAN
ncbi:MAG: hypothetical protein IPN90_07690 [Elusimicrobia bacterium]|nr:hypothetical protein [Elusimicrobiota bacterium]